MMAKINARGLRQIGPTLYTERTRPPVADWDHEAVYYEAFRLRSDGSVLTRIIRTWDPADKSKTTEHRGSSFRILGKMGHAQDATIDDLRAWLVKKGFTIVKESWR